MRITLTIAALAALAAGGAAAQTELRLSIETPPGHVRNLAAERWAEAIEEMSGGDITVEVFPAGQLYDSAGAIRALAAGSLDMSIQASPTLSQFEPNMSVITLPMFFGATREDVRGILDGPLGDELWGMLEGKGIVVPEGGHFEFAPNNSAYTTEAVVESYDDLQGVKLATPPSPVVVSILQQMGANPVATPRTEIVLQLTQGQIDGMGSVTDLTISGGKLWEAGIAHAFADNAGWGVYIPLVSAGTMENLTEEQQQIVQDAWGEVVGWARDYAAEELETARATNEENGVVYVDPPEEMVAAMREQMVGLQDQIVGDSGMNADFVSRVQAELDAE
ncbi:TRAP transporter substrate-binding protein DctP [Wenxinia marina]|uniref:TRAP-type C4-dicarboxylate transport system, periplasmic component n=1 Tax=Wenxinia marina DSM 24838 TaxID=1123501 RepID=A0A0D0QC08_9RHOB|nr:TRAP transporter substrate-binding protein DctP [Wenxinia marina]KIQ69827.1 TRAP-type C4-dicarboxylate transport system, periplasmic component [Wenxinia marina DSM 24838]GGL61563.1 C4-dicarboxylate ABC transporter [Wenxinia marina]